MAIYRHERLTNGLVVVIIRASKIKALYFMSKIFLRIAICLLYPSLFGVFFVGEVLAETKVTTKYENYLVQGNDLKQINNSIKENGIQVPGGRSFAAETNYKVELSYDFNESEHGCGLVGVNSEVIITYKMPYLVNYDDLTQDDRVVWSSYYQSLREHEMGHARLGVRAASLIEWELSNLLPMENCAKVVEAANKIEAQILAAYHKHNVEYDRETAHGNSQGAFLLARN